MTPNPKKIALRLKPKAYRELRRTAWLRAGGYCEVCGTFAPLDNTEMGVPAGHFHHVKSVGSGGEDKISNGDWLCWECHRKKDDPQWSQRGVGI